MFEDIEKNYDSKPLIVIHDKNQLEEMIKQLDSCHYKYLIGVSE